MSGGAMNRMVRCGVVLVTDREEVTSWSTKN